MRNLSVFLPHRSCPGRCVYCNQREITGVSPPAPGEVRALVRSAGEPVELCYFGGSFTCLPWAEQRAYLDALDAAAPGSRLRCSTHPLCVAADALERLQGSPFAAIELGVSSLEDEVLAACNRGYRGEEALAALERLARYGFRAGAQLMLGLPGQSGKSALRDLYRLARCNRPGAPLQLRLYPCLVLEDTTLAAMYRRGDFRPLTLEEAVDQGARWLETAEALGFRVLRIGLHETPSLERSVVAGPHHPALGELIRAAALARRLYRRSATGPWTVPARCRSQLYGHGRFGLQRLAALTSLQVSSITERLVFTL